MYPLPFTSVLIYGFIILPKSANWTRRPWGFSRVWVLIIAYIIYKPSGSWTQALKSMLLCLQFVIVYRIVMKNKSSELTRLDWVGIRLNQFEMFEERFKLTIKMKIMWFKVWNSVVWKPWINCENCKSLELTI